MEYLLRRGTLLFSTIVTLRFLPALLSLILSSLVRRENRARSKAGPPTPVDLAPV